MLVPDRYRLKEAAALGELTEAQADALVSVAAEALTLCDVGTEPPSPARSEAEQAQRWRVLRARIQRCHPRLCEVDGPPWEGVEGP